MLCTPMNVQIHAFVHTFRPTYAAMQIPFVAHLLGQLTPRESQMRTGSEIFLTFMEKKQKFTSRSPEMIFIDWLIHSLNKYLLNAYYVSGLVQVLGI